MEEECVAVERNLNFDEFVERRHTDSLKYDFAVRRGKPAEVLPLWVADMYFPTSSRVLDAVEARVRHGIFGYTEPTESYFEALTGWMQRRHGWKADPRWVVKTPGVVFALAMAVKAYTKPGEAVLMQQPVYYPFSEVIEDNDRRVVSSDLVRDEDGRYRMDFDDFEEKIRENQIRLFLLCSPHNPVGRVWEEWELLRVGEICLRHGVTVVSDEIHEDFVFGGHRHLVFASLREEFRDISVTCTSPGKTFNLAGLQVSNIFIPDATRRRAFRRQVNAAGYSQMNTLGLTACEAAYRYGDIWYEAMLRYVEANMTYVRSFAEENLPGVKTYVPEGTYLMWLDFRGLGLTEAEREELIVRRAGLWLDSGAIFGAAGEGYERINAACPRSVLEEALGRLARALADNRRQ
ncbi:MAG: pyridoxal phosphate-dependent aminotransferase [Lachnospiraceae bacterium]|nr:pyridoxal phosphate-dependent aminotransferase [Lachnospiraceae bacterium]